MDTCRACMTENDENKMIFLFDAAEKVAEIFSKCMSLDAIEVDELPAHICLICHEMLMGYNKFRLKCLASDTYFRQRILSPIKVECSLPYDGDAIKTSTKTNRLMKYESSNTRAHITVEPDIHLNQHNDNAVKSDSSNDQDPIEMPSDNDDTYCDGASIEDGGDEDDETEDEEEEDDDNKQKSNKQKEIKSTKSKRKANASKNEPEHKKKNINCEICGKKFLKQNRLEEHLRQHQGLKACVCKVCGKEFAKARNLVMHMRRFHEDDRFKTTFSCDEEGCGKSYNLKETLIAHKRRMHSVVPVKPQTKRFVCDACGKLFKTNAALTKHSYTHTGLMPFMCTLCPKKFATKDKLKEHTMRHEGVKNHICLICGVGKTTSYELKAHMNYHTKEKLFPCNLCTSVFFSNRNMRRHIRVVHCGKIESAKTNVSNIAEKPHECTECGKRFSHLIVFQTHLRKHTNAAT